MRKTLIVLSIALLFAGFTRDVSGPVFAATIVNRHSVSPGLNRPASYAPTDAVDQFYRALDVKDFSTAYSLLSPWFQSTQPFDGWRRGYATTARVGADVWPTDDLTTVGIYLTAIDEGSDYIDRLSRFTGTWQLVQDSGGNWLLDRATIQVVAAFPTDLAPAYDFSAFASGWSHHGFGVSIAADGTGSGSWRIYQWCSDNPMPPCDSISGNNIYNGGRGQFVLDRASGSTASGFVTGTSDPAGLSLGPIWMTLLPYDTAVIGQGSHVILLCGPNAYTAPFTITMYCGA